MASVGRFLSLVLGGICGVGVFATSLSSQEPTPTTGMLPPEAQLATAAVPFERFLFPFVAQGVTTVQVLSAIPDHIPLRAQIIQG